MSFIKQKYSNKKKKNKNNQKKSLNKRSNKNNSKYGGMQFLSNMIGNEDQKYIATKKCSSSECCYEKDNNPFDIDKIYKDDFNQSKLADQVQCLQQSQSNLRFENYLCNLRTNLKNILNFDDDKIKFIYPNYIYNASKLSKCK